MHAKQALLAILLTKLNFGGTYTVEPLYNSHHWGMAFWPL